MKKINRIGLVIAVLLFILSVNSTFYFLGIAKSSVLQWLNFNACAPTGVVFILGYLLYRIKGHVALLYASAVPLFFFGTMGLFIFPWDGYNLMAQANHIVMTGAVIWIFRHIYLNQDSKALFWGQIISVTFCLPLIALQQIYCRVNAEELLVLLGIN
ncbi:MULTISPECIES: hypothetical protein [unclassified Fusibacter]|uniref:hypothetical protein n=1 Tax=unclassified Fusibacter TaxID=2624464 RepID=UPI001012F165|nr:MULTISPECIES: hypothetical protein [unclassified Fusibacter]MCK8060266.1 hypothetical protein [Fusibacter sp. A2]NPE20445.1 hypothetical protein [Fusibacter sp. A1]RXV63650.1 hypothetical protein DWB64_01345 [Fusibacter sp. A1]